MIDTHCHIDEEAFAPDREEVIARQQAAGVEAMVVPGVNVASIESVLQVCAAHPNYCYPALGLHPEDVKTDWQVALETIDAAIRAHRSELVAIGEIGLDYYWDKTYKEEQKEVLRRQLATALELDLPVILHNRDATEDILQIVHEIGGRGVFHCFSGSKETARQILEMGFYLGIGGVLTFKNSKLREHLSVVPMNRIVLETDAPYMAPVPHRGERNESQWMVHVAESLADVYKCSVECIIDTTTANAKHLFGIK